MQGTTLSPDWNNDTFTMLAHVEICTISTDPITELL